ncbi:hypothetical protein WJX73_004207 [Symbiochloris irregularis]|uniref:HTH La-type RNA-binding domain-containing protein n=1 Tax=Symbiochloris irregularis TaxID=706552 RepID=A0AAW1PVE0_9CHLO
MQKSFQEAVLNQPSKRPDSKETRQEPVTPPSPAKKVIVDAAQPPPLKSAWSKIPQQAPSSSEPRGTTAANGKQPSPDKGKDTSSSVQANGTEAVSPSNAGTSSQTPAGQSPTAADAAVKKETITPAPPPLKPAWKKPEAVESQPVTPLSGTQTGVAWPSLGGSAEQRKRRGSSAPPTPNSSSAQAKPSPPSSETSVVPLANLRGDGLAPANNAAARAVSAGEASVASGAASQVDHVSTASAPDRIGTPPGGTAAAGTSSTVASGPVSIGAYMAQQLAALCTQIEYYFSRDNLAKDMYLKKQMNEEGWIPLTVICGFPRVRQLTNEGNEAAMVLTALQTSLKVEISPNGLKLRSRDDWPDFVLPPDQRDPNAHADVPSATSPPPGGAFGPAAGSSRSQMSGVGPRSLRTNTGSSATSRNARRRGDTDGLDGSLRRSSGGEAGHQLPSAASRGMQSAPASPSGKRQGALQVATQGFLGAGNKAVSEASTPPPRHLQNSPFQQPQEQLLSGKASHDGSEAGIARPQSAAPDFTETYRLLLVIPSSASVGAESSADANAMHEALSAYEQELQSPAEAATTSVKGPRFFTVSSKDGASTSGQSADAEPGQRGYLLYKYPQLRDQCLQSAALFQFYALMSEQPVQPHLHREFERCALKYHNDHRCRLGLEKLHSLYRHPGLPANITLDPQVKQACSELFENGAYGAQPTAPQENGTAGSTTDERSTEGSDAGGTSLSAGAPSFVHTPPSANGRPLPSAAAISAVEASKHDAEADVGNGVDAEPAVSGKGPAKGLSGEEGAIPNGCATDVRPHAKQGGDAAQANHDPPASVVTSAAA